MRGFGFGSFVRPALVVGAALALPACGASLTERRPEGPDAPRPVADARELCLVAGHGAWQLDLHFGDPARDPAHLYFWVAGRPGRLGLDADPETFGLPPGLVFGLPPPPVLATSQWLSAAPVTEP